MASCHIRSVSLPPLSHPLTSGIEEKLLKLKASRSSSISHKLGDLKHFYEGLYNFLQLSHAQKSFYHEAQGECVENALSGSLRLLDICCTTRDIYVQMKECAQELESSLRRTRSREFSTESEIDAYLVSRKRLNKMICKCVENLKRKEKTCQTVPLEGNCNLEKVTRMLRGVEEASLEVFESNLSFISYPKAKSKLSSWPVVSKFLITKHASSCEPEVEGNGAENINAELLVLRSSKDRKFLQIQNFLERLKSFQSTLQEVEEDLDYIYRLLVKTRVSLLNILHHYDF